LLQKISNALEKISNALERISCHTCIIFGTVMTGTVMISVFSRYFFKYSFPWIGELSRYLLVWIALLAGGVVLKRGGLARMTALLFKIPKPFKRIISLIVELLILLFSLYSIWYGMIQAVATINQTSPIIRLSMFWVYLSVPVSFSIIVIHTANKIIKLFEDFC